MDNVGGSHHSGYRAILPKADPEKNVESQVVAVVTDDATAVVETSETSQGEGREGRGSKSLADRRVSKQRHDDLNRECLEDLKAKIGKEAFETRKEHFKAMFSNETPFDRAYVEKNLGRYKGAHAQASELYRTNPVSFFAVLVGNRREVESNLMKFCQVKGNKDLIDSFSSLSRKLRNKYASEKSSFVQKQMLSSEGVQETRPFQRILNLSSSVVSDWEDKVDITGTPIDLKADQTRVLNAPLVVVDTQSQLPAEGIQVTSEKAVKK